MSMPLLKTRIGIRASNLPNIDFSVPLVKTEALLLVGIQHMANVTSLNERNKLQKCRVFC